MRIAHEKTGRTMIVATKGAGALHQTDPRAHARSCARVLERVVVRTWEEEP